MSLGRYVNKPGVSVTRGNNPLFATVTQVNRLWNDANNNFFPDCNLRNTAANGECAQVSDLLFGQVRLNTRYDPEMLKGFCVRESLWDLSAEVQHELLQGVSLTAGSYRNWGAVARRPPVRWRRRHGTHRRGPLLRGRFPAGAALLPRRATLAGPDPAEGVCVVRDAIRHHCQ